MVGTSVTKELRVKREPKEFSHKYLFLLKNETSIPPHEESKFMDILDIQNPDWENFKYATFDKFLPKTKFSM